MKKLLGLALALSMLLNAALLLRKPAPVVRTQVVERTVTSEPQIVLVSRTDADPAPIVVSAPLPVPAVLAAPPAVQLLAGPSDVASGAPVKVTCMVLSGKASPRQWIGLYVAGAKVGSTSAYLMVHEGAEYEFKAPRAAGTYEFRYVLEDDATSIAASNPFRVYEEPSARPLVDLQSGTTYVKAGGEIPASWALLSGRRTPQDWIGLYAAGAKNEDFLSWKYVTDADRGQVRLQAPDKPGTYEMRYLLDNGYESVATSIRIVVLP
jgi:Ca-activated chloride channel family protein